jgi:hypothetical protein
MVRDGRERRSESATFHCDSVMAKHGPIERKKYLDVEPPARVNEQASAFPPPPAEGSEATGHRFASLPILDRSQHPDPSSDAETATPIQTKLTIGEPNDPLEEEADAIAETVVESVENGGAAKPHAVSRKPKVQAKAASGGSAVGDSTHDTIESVVNSGGQPLSDATRAFMEPRFGHSFGDVRVHADSEAARSAALVQARAYTLGSNIVFGAGQFAPETNDGRRLLAHELTHVIQQTTAAPDAENATTQRAIQRDPNASIAPPTPAPMSTTPPAPAPPGPAGPGSAPPTLGGSSATAHQGSAQSVRVTVSTGPDPEYTSNSRNSGSGTITLSANAEETYASLRALGAADMWNMACVVGNLSNWAASAPNPAPDTSPGGSDSVKIANANPADTAYDDNYRAAFPAFKGHVQTFYKRFKDFQTQFKDNGTKATLGLVKESRARTKKSLEDLGITPEVEHERGPLGQEYTTTYKSDSAKNKAMSAAAAELYKKQDALEKLLEKRKDVRGIVNSLITSNENLDKEEKELDKQIADARPAWEEEKRKARREYPVLTHFESTEQLKLLSNPASTAHHVGSKLNEILGNIDELEEKLNAGNDRILTLPEHLTRLTESFNLNDFERRTVWYMREKYTGDIETGQRVAVLIAIVLAAIAAAPTAGGSLVALAAIGDAAINTTLLLQAYDQYSFEKAATGSNEDKAEALSHDEPSLFWLAFQFVTTAIGVAGNAKVAMKELSAAFSEVKAGYKTAAATGQTGKLESALSAQKVPKEAAEGIVARALKDSVAILEGIAKGGPEGLQAALDLFKTSPSFYGVRLAVWRIKAGGGVAQATQNIQAARQQVINKIVEDTKAKYPKITLAVVDQGFEKPLIVKIGSTEAPPTAPPSGPPSSPPPSSGPPSSAPPSSGPPSSAPPSTVPASAGSAVTAKAADDALPPEALKTPAKPLPPGILVQTTKSADAAAVADTATAGSGTSVGAPAAAADASQASPMGSRPLGGVVAPGARSVDAPPGGGFHPPMEIPEGARQAMDAADALRDAPQVAFGGAPAGAGADLAVEMDQTVAPYGQMRPTMQVYYGIHPSIPKPEYSGIYMNVSKRFTEHADLTQKFAGKGSSVKVILQDKAGGANPPLFMFKPGGGEHVGAAASHEVRPGVFFIKGRAAYDIALDLPSVGKDIVPLGIVVYNGEIGSLQPFIKNSENLLDLKNGRAINPMLRANGPQLYEEIWETNPQFKTFRENLRAYDHVINNPDRNMENYMVEFNDDLTIKRFYAIDQDMALKPGARSVMWKHREVVPRFTNPNQLPNPMQDLHMPNAQQAQLGKISKALYDEFVELSVNEHSARQALAGAYGLDQETLDGIFKRLKEVVADYNLRLQTMNPADVFAD